MGKEPLPVFVFGCMACGKTVAGNERSCPRCGSPFDGVMFECPFCGELISPIQRRCETCGTEFRAFAEEVSETSAVSLDGADSSVDDKAGSESGTGTDSGPSEPSSKPTPQASERPSDIVEYECPVCGKPVSENDVKCPHCGTSFQ